MIVTILCSSTPLPSGGGLGIIEFANALAARGHEVHLAHGELLGMRVSSLEQLAWADLDERLIHHFGGEPEDLEVPGSQVVIGYDHRLPAHLGEPANFIQAYRVLPPGDERLIFDRPAPKLCTSSWLRHVAIALGNPESQTFLLPYGLRPEKFRVVTPVADRPRRVCFLVNPHPLKRAALGLEALDIVRRRDPSVEIITFGIPARPSGLDATVEYRTDPSQAALVEEIYNTSAVFLQTAQLEGFGLAPLESQACGCALVTTDNGGSWDYAIDGQTAAVVPADADAIAARILGLLDDDGERFRLAAGGLELARRYRWDESGRIFEGILERYLEDPARFQRPVVEGYDRRLIANARDVGDAPHARTVAPSVAGPANRPT